MNYRAKLLALLAALFTSSIFAQSTQRGYFVVTLGSDTIAVETYELSAFTIRGTSIARAPQTASRSYILGTNNQGVLEYFHFATGPVGGEARFVRDIHFTDDSLQVSVTQDGSKKESSIKVAGRPYPFIADIIGPWYFAITNAVASKGAREFSILAGTRTPKYEIHGTVPGTLELANPNFGPIFATLDGEGRLVRFDMTRTTDKFIVERADQLDMDAVGRSFVEREKSGSPLGVLSPRDTARATIHGANILIDYGRPSARGRKVFGGVVPWGVVWRLGANAATQLITDKPLLFGKTTVAPGTYSLFALPSQGTWQLIINTQHGQWGTVYDQTKDLARLPLKTERLDQPVERFGVHIVARGNSGVLEFEWENTKASLPFDVR